MRSGRILVRVGVYVLGLTVLGALVWLIRILWSAAIGLDVSGINIFWLVELCGILVCIFAGFLLIPAVYYAAHEVKDYGYLEDMLNFLPAERKAIARCSTMARATQAYHNDKWAEAIRLYAGVGAYTEALDVVQRRLSNGTVGRSLLTAGREFMELERCLDIARQAGVPKEVTSLAASHAKATAMILWERAARVAATAEYRLRSDRLDQGLEREADRLNRLEQAIRQVREGLAELTLGGGLKGIAEVEARFRALAATAREVQEEELG